MLLNLYLPSNTVAMQIKGTQTNVESAPAFLWFYHSEVATPLGIEGSAMFPLGRLGEAEAQEGATLWLAKTNPVSRGLVTFSTEAEDRKNIPYTPFVTSSVVFYTYEP